MPAPQIADPRGVLRTVTDYTTFKDSAGNPITTGGVIEYHRLNDTVTFGDLVGLVAPTTTVPASVELLDVSDAFSEFVCIGVAQEGGVAGDVVPILTHGLTIINIGNTGTIAIGDAVVEHASTDGKAGVIAVASIDAAVITGRVFGNYLTPEIGTTDTAIAYIRL